MGMFSGTLMQPQNRKTKRKRPWFKPGTFPTPVRFHATTPLSRIPVDCKLCCLCAKTMSDKRKVRIERWQSKIEKWLFSLDPLETGFFETDISWHEYVDELLTVFQISLNEVSFCILIIMILCNFSYCVIILCVVGMR